MFRNFKWRAFISICLFISFFIIFITGLVLYLAPVGWVARWIDWRIIGMTKEKWEAMHTVFSYLFAIFAVIHLFSMNWKLFLNYIKIKAVGTFKKKMELISALLLSLLIFIGTLFSIPPFDFIMDFGSKLSDSWEKSDEKPPVDNAEKLSLDEFASVLNISSSSLLSILTQLEIQFDNKDQTIQDISKLNHQSPLEFYLLVVDSLNKTKY